LFSLRFDETDVSPTLRHVLRHLGFERGIANKHDQGKHLLIIQAQKSLQRFHMFVVLVKRVLKPLGVTIDLLGPLALFGIAKDPAFHVLGFHHEHAELGDDDVVDLGSAVFRGQGDVLDQVVAVFIEEHTGGEVNNELSQMPFEPART